LQSNCNVIATFNNISVISWRPVLLVDKITDLSQITDKLYHIMLLSNTPSHERDSNQLGVKTNRTVLCGNRRGHHNTELRTQRLVIGQHTKTEKVSNTDSTALNSDAGKG
jgi:hypothetical protein